jgi:hypothetical protein
MDNKTAVQHSATPTHKMKQKRDFLHPIIFLKQRSPRWTDLPDYRHYFPRQFLRSGYYHH